LVVGDFVLVMKDVISKYLRTNIDMKQEQYLSLEELDNLLELLGKSVAMNRGDLTAGGYQKLTS
jgi:hypothetical protein